MFVVTATVLKLRLKSTIELNLPKALHSVKGETMPFWSFHVIYIPMWKIWGFTKVGFFFFSLNYYSTKMCDLTIICDGAGIWRRQKRQKIYDQTKILELCVLKSEYWMGLNGLHGLALSGTHPRTCHRSCFICTPVMRRGITVPFGHMRMWKWGVSDYTKPLLQ